MFRFFSKKKANDSTSKTGGDPYALWDADLDTIWSIPDQNQFLIALHSRICRKCGYGENMDTLSAAERIFYLNTQLECEVNNGGFSQFFSNASGAFSGEIEDSLRAIGAEHTADIYVRALRAVGGPLPAEQAPRDAILSALSQEGESILEACDRDFYAYPDDLNALNDQFILRNKDQFS